jgi:hypothetical protein
MDFPDIPAGISDIESVVVLKRVSRLWGGGRGEGAVFNCVDPRWGYSGRRNLGGVPRGLARSLNGRWMLLQTGWCRACHHHPRSPAKGQRDAAGILGGARAGVVTVMESTGPCEVAMTAADAAAVEVAVGASSARLVGAQGAAVLRVVARPIRCVERGLVAFTPAGVHRITDDA